MKKAIEYRTYAAYVRARDAKGLQAIPRTLWNSLKAEQRHEACKVLTEKDVLHFEFEGVCKSTGNAETRLVPASDLLNLHETFYGFCKKVHWKRGDWSWAKSWVSDDGTGTVMRVGGGASGNLDLWTRDPA